MPPSSNGWCNIASKIPSNIFSTFVIPAQTLRDLSEAAMREVIGDRTVDEVITIGRQDIEIAALARMQELAKRYMIGMRVDQVQLKNVNPPAEVQASFNEVNKAQQDRENAINIANGDYNEAVPRARGQADQTIRAAEGYRFKRVNEAEGDVASFNAILAEYVKAPEITRTRLYLETMGDVFRRPAKKSSSTTQCETCCRSSRSTPNHWRRNEQTRLPVAGLRSRFILVAARVLIGCFYVVYQTQQVIVTQFGKPVGEPITEPGLHFKLPIIQEVNRIDKRFLEWGGSPVAIPTRDKTYIHVDTFARWRISDPKTISSACATNAAPNRVWKTFSAARRATPWPSMI